MKILILGGTRFLGPALVEAALERGHEITLFNRGKTNPDLFPELEKLRGDRDGKLDALRGRRWNAVIDTSGYVPRVVSMSAELLAGAVQIYAFVSTISVYKDLAKPGIDEDYPVGTLEDETVEQITGETYGPLKALCERAAEEAMPGRVLTVRPGLIVGPRDSSDRFTYWPVRIADGGEVLAPGDPDRPVQFIDVRDLAEFIVKMIEDGHVGTFNAVGPKYPPSFFELLAGCKIIAGSDARFTVVPDAFLLEQKVGPWMELPLWLPGEENAGLNQVDARRARARGLAFRTPGETISDTLDWARSLPPDRSWRAGLAREKEKKLLATWHERTSKPKGESEGG